MVFPSIREMTGLSIGRGTEHPKTKVSRSFLQSFRQIPEELLVNTTTAAMHIVSNLHPVIPCCIVVVY
jgi:hypothetical protein